MSSTLLISCLLLAPYLCSGQWCYESQNTCDDECKGPRQWVSDFPACGGQRQSPINIITRKVQYDPSLTPIMFEGYTEVMNITVTNEPVTWEQAWGYAWGHTKFWKWAQGQRRPEPRAQGQRRPEPRAQGQRRPEPRAQGQRRPEPRAQGQRRPEPRAQGQRRPEPRAQGQRRPEPRELQVLELGQQVLELELGQQVLELELGQQVLELELRQQVLELELRQQVLELELRQQVLELELRQQVLELELRLRLEQQKLLRAQSQRRPEPRELGQRRPGPRELGQRRPGPRELGQRRPGPRELGQRRPEPRAQSQRRPEPRAALKQRRPEPRAALMQRRPEPRAALMQRRPEPRAALMQRRPEPRAALKQRRWVLLAWARQAPLTWRRLPPRAWRRLAPLAKKPLQRELRVRLPPRSGQELQIQQWAWLSTPDRSLLPEPESKIWKPAGLVSWKPVGLECWKSAALESWKPAALECWKSAALESWKPAALESWKPAALESWKPAALECWKSAALESWKPAELETAFSLPPSVRISGGGLPGKYKALQFHLHWGSDCGPGSEHTVDGEQYPMEVHIVHIKEEYSTLKEAMNDSVGVAALGFFFEVSPRENKQLNKIIDALGRVRYNGNSTDITGFQLGDLLISLENFSGYYRYAGSLTTPSCDEAIIWTLFKQPIPVSQDQLNIIIRQMLFSTGKPMIDIFRPVLNLNGRTVYTSHACPCVLLSLITLLLCLIFVFELI
ncbi:carbonic anhydrase 4-like [Astyanax mexicanus]|uniref:Carbonic anhydrase n=1 Tax=Astyanax mexicanus TaxID=7994 RepID=A0A8T2L273_ASTMX|nr:carbonic anhydrase 4-like [Astyanax mexicanus]